MGAQQPQLQQEPHRPQQELRPRPQLPREDVVNSASALKNHALRPKGSKSVRFAALPPAEHGAPYCANCGARTMADGNSTFCYRCGAPRSAGSLNTGPSQVALARPVAPGRTPPSLVVLATPVAMGRTPIRCEGLPRTARGNSSAPVKVKPFKKPRGGNCRRGRSPKLPPRFGGCPLVLAAVPTEEESGGIPAKMKRKPEEGIQRRQDEYLRAQQGQRQQMAIATVAMPAGPSSSDRYRAPRERNEEGTLGGLGPAHVDPTAPEASMVSAMPGRPLPLRKEACSDNIACEWIDDTGAGRHLSSIKHIARYFGVSPETVLKWAHNPSEDISFYTGGGSDKKAKLALTTVSTEWGNNELRLLDDCPEVRSSGLIVEELDRPRIHWPGDAPYYVRDKKLGQVVCPEWNRIYPVRVEENVPIFSDEVVYADPEEVPALLLERNWLPFFSDEAVYANPEEVRTLPAPPEDEAPGGEPPAPAAPPPADGEGAGIAIAPPPPPPPPAHLDSLIERKRKEATSAEHLRTHFPKNPFCEWCQRGRMTSLRMRRRRQDPDVLPEQPLPTKVGERTPPTPTWWLRVRPTR